MRRTFTTLLAALLLAACPDKERIAAPVVEEKAPVEEPAAGTGTPARESVCDCTCEGEDESCRCAPLTWRVGCGCFDDEMHDCACDCKGEILVSVDEMTTEAVADTPPELLIRQPTKEELAREVPPPPPPPPDAS